MACTDSGRTSLRLIVADPQPVFREGLSRILGAEPDLTVVGSAADGRQTIEMTTEYQPDVLLLDVVMPDMSGLAALRAIHELAVRVIFVPAVIEPEDVRDALRLGARGFVMKVSTSEVLVNAIHAVMAGDYWIGDNRETTLDDALRHIARPAGDRRRFGLTTRELDVIRMIVAGLSNSVIAARFTIGESTVKQHLRSIFDKLGVHNRLELMLFALHHKLARHDVDVGEG